MARLRLATAPDPAPASPDGPGSADIVRELDEAHGGRWSFQVVSHELRRREVVVLGELEIAGQIRQQFGAADPGRCPRRPGRVRGAVQERIRGGSGEPPLRRRLNQVRDAIERLPCGKQAFREVLRGFQVRRPEHIPEESLPDVISRCEQFYRVPPPPSANGRNVHP